MKKIKLNKEEREIMVRIERNEFIPVTGKALRKVVKAINSWKKKVRNA